MKINGACHCGRITFEAEVDPSGTVICHCTDCQTLSGTAFRVAVLARRETFKLLSGALKIYIKTGESGNQREQSFCPECGTPIYSTDPAGTQGFNIRVGTVRQRGELRPKAQIWTRSARGWLRDLESIAKLEKQ